MDADSAQTDTSPIASSALSNQASEPGTLVEDTQPSLEANLSSETRYAPTPVRAVHQLTSVDPPTGTQGRAGSPVATIHLEPSDDMAVVQARLRTAYERRVVLIVPGGTRLFRRETNFARLRSWTAAQGLAVVLVSYDPQIRSLGRQFDVPVYGSAGRARRKARSLNPSLVTHQHSRRLSMPAHRGWEEWLLLLILIVGIGVVGLAAAFLVWPQATITVVPTGMALEQQVRLTADTSIELVDQVAAEIPARLVQTEIKGQATVSTLARKDAPDAKATGEIVFINRSNESVEVPVGTFVATSSGTTIKFTTLERVMMPAGLGSMVGARIEALDPGPSGNVGPFIINQVVDVVLATKLRVANELHTQGGSVKQVGMVTAADKERLRVMLRQQLDQEALAKLEADLDPQEFLPVESISVIALDETYDHLLGEATEFLGMTMRIRAKGIAFDLSQAQRIARSELEQVVPARHALQPESFHAEVIEAGLAEPDPNEMVQSSRVSLVMKARGQTEAVMTPGRVISLVQGRSTAEAVMELQANLPLRSPPLVVVEPSWWDRVPWLPLRIQVVVVSERG